MSILSYLSQSSRPQVEADFSRMTYYTDFGQNLGAGLRSAFREFNSLGQAATELRIGALVDEEFFQSPTLDYKAARDNPLWRFSNPNNPIWRNLLLPRYTDRDELRGLLAERGMNFSDKIPIPPEGLNLPRAIVYQQNFEAQEADEAIMAHARPGVVSFAAQLAGGLIGSIADPINFIPYAGGLRRAQQVARGTKILSRAGAKFIAQSAMIGAGENAAAAAVSSALVFPLANRWGAELGWEDAAGFMAFGGALGSVFGGLGGIAGLRTRAALHQDASVKAIADLIAGRNPDVAAILEDVIRTAESQGVQVAPAARRFVTPETRGLLVERMMKAGRTMEQAAADSEVAARQATFLAKITGADPNALLQGIKFAQGLDTPAGIQTYHQFAGERSNLSESVREGLSEAIALNVRGTDNEAIRQKTGWFKGMDGQWRYEIPDHPSYFKLPENIKNGAVFRLGDIYDNPKLYEFYPDLKNLEVYFREIEGKAGSYTPRQPSLSGGLNDDFITINLNNDD